MADSVSKDGTLVCSISEFETTNKRRFTIEGRDIFLVKTHGKFYALDSICYHAGGPLYNGDIEDLGGRTCVVCPWHKYKVCLDTGQNYYQLSLSISWLLKSVDPHNLSKPPVWTTGDVRQRTHTLVVREGSIYIQLSEMDGSLDSDHHNLKRINEKD